mmetsp:Transcript_20357/g.51420  ORF Transcript_20357/g.51420 Transcript_20357/m.51420 type:complete len:87 (-) Transcript_20357:2742-3002(-)
MQIVQMHDDVLQHPPTDDSCKLKFITIMRREQVKRACSCHFKSSIEFVVVACLVGCGAGGGGPRRCETDYDNDIKKQRSYLFSRSS